MKREPLAVVVVGVAGDKVLEVVLGVLDAADLIVVVDKVSGSQFTSASTRSRMQQP